jgi:hypothetical protein
VHFRGELGDGEPVGGRREGERGRQSIAHAWLVEVDAADPGGAERRSGGQSVEDAVTDESGVHAVQGGGEPFGGAGESGDDLGELVDHPSAAQLRGVVHDRLGVCAEGFRVPRSARNAANHSRRALSMLSACSVRRGMPPVFHG